MATQTDKVVRRRFAIVMVEADTDWLTCDGDMTEEEGWQIINDDLCLAVNYLYRIHGTQLGPLVSLEEWENDKEPEDDKPDFVPPNNNWKGCVRETWCGRDKGHPANCNP